MANLFETSLADLYDSAVAAFPLTTMRQHAVQPIELVHMQWTPFVGMKTLFIKTEVRNETRHYNTMILFKGVDYHGNQVKIVGSDGKLYSLNKLSLENSDVLVKCGCADFQWRFRHYNHIDKSLYGKNRKKYESKGGPPANPLQMPGMCKHLMKTIVGLRDAGIFKN